MGDLSYVYAVARIRVREKSLLTDADVSQMVGMKDDKAVLAYLSDRGWGDPNLPADADSVLSAEEKKTMELVKELKIDPAVFELLSYPNLYHNLKAGIKENFTTEAHSKIFYEDSEPGRDAILRILKEKNYQELPEHMQAAAEEANEAMLKTGDGQLCDVIVDRACLTAMVRAGEKSKSQLLREYARSTAAVTDIRIAARALRTGKSLNFLKKALAPCEGLAVRQLAAAAADSSERLLGFLEENGFKEAADALRESPSAFERWCDDRLMETIRPQKMNSVSMDPIIAYYLARMNEIKTVRVILTAKANGFPEEAVRERVRGMYV